MKSFLALALIFTTLSSFADEMEMTDKGSLQLSNMLNDRSVLCGPEKNAKLTIGTKKLYPLTITAKKLSPKKVLLSVEVNDPKERFGFGGDQFDDVERSASWTNISSGDDGRAHIQFQNFDREDIETYKCDEADLKKGLVTQNLSAVHYIYWRPGEVTAQGLGCCLK